MTLKTGALGACLLLAACSGGSDGNSADQAPEPTALVTLGAATRGDITQTVTLYGVAEAGAAGNIALSVAAEAIVAQIVATVGTKVTRGQLVVQLSPAPNTRLDLAKASADARAADAAYARAKRLRADGLVGDAQVETARAAAQSADATLASYRGRAGSLALKAPVSGYVATIAANPGDLVQAGATVATISNSANVRARFGADPSVARALSVGSPIRIAGTSSRAPLTAPIRSIDPVVDPTTRLASVFASLASSTGIAVGETLQGTVATQAQGNALTIPYAALLNDGGQPYVFVVTGGVAHRHDVETGSASDDRIAIVKGVGAGDKVVTAGGTALDDGMKVRTR